MAILNLYEIDSIYMALHELSKGRLSRYLISSTSLTAGIRDIPENLERTSPEFQLIYKTLNYYCTQAKVGGAIHKKSNIINYPGSHSSQKRHISTKNLKIYLIFFCSSDNQKFYSILYNAPKFIAYSENNLFYFTAANINELPFHMSNSQKLCSV